MGRRQASTVFSAANPRKRRRGPRAPSPSHTPPFPIAAAAATAAAAAATAATAAAATAAAATAAAATAAAATAAAATAAAATAAGGTRPSIRTLERRVLEAAAAPRMHRPAPLASRVPCRKP
ncbi:hypothetical protein Emag_000637 [Eimeria magna]